MAKKTGVKGSDGGKKDTCMQTNKSLECKHTQFCRLASWPSDNIINRNHCLLESVVDLKSGCRDALADRRPRP